MGQIGFTGIASPRKDRIRPRQPAGTYDPDCFPTAELPAFAWEEAEFPVMRVQAVVQARMTSSRLPGKVLRPLDGKPMLLSCWSGSRDAVPSPAWSWRRRSRGKMMPWRKSAGKRVYPVSGAICSTWPPVSRGIGPLSRRCFRARQCRQSAARSGAYRPGGALYRSADADLVSNVFPRSFPPGQSVEVIRTDTFLTALDDMSNDVREHVTLHFYRNASRFRIRNFTALRPYRDCIWLWTPRRIGTVQFLCRGHGTAALALWAGGACHALAWRARREAS
ncbi:hypothetical protein D3869_32075 (plasmid) [Azospirillum brasilense]|uniref:Uncharacterized protein n=1 Tax=Azospirillum brasilense TaxID=192 RepID=A0A4D8RH52_AZOBR|nr:hypothetical protein D3869_32075 [Azospirillum brasilense]